MSQSGKIVTVGQSAGKSFAYLLGVYLGDGCVTRVQGYLRFRLNVIDLDFAQSVSKAIGDVTGTCPKVYGPYADKRFVNAAAHYELLCMNRELCESLVNATDSKEHLPESLETMTKAEKLAFVAGLMDSEGFVTANRSNPSNRRFHMGFKACAEWVPEFGRFLEMLGIRIGKVARETPRKLGHKIPIRFGVKMQSWIDAGAYFNCQRKQSRVNEWASIGPYERRARYPRKAKANLNEHTQRAATP